MDVLLTPANLAAVICGYFIGSIPFGLLLTRLAGLGDIRAVGSGNIGATNVLRTGNTPLAVATLLLDTLKGFVAVAAAYVIAQSITPAPSPSNVIFDNYPWMTTSLGGLSAFLGHLFPVWLRFKGGKGVATLIGVLFGIAWPIALAFCALWLATAYLTRFSSLAALVASILSLAAAYIFAPPHVTAALSFMTVLLIWKHRENITRLSKGEEPKIGGAKETK